MKLINKKFHELGFIAVALLFLFSLVSCGGGGGSAGTVSGSSSTSATTVGSVSLLFSSPSLKSSGEAGSEVTVTAVVKNQNNVTLTGIPVDFSADSGALAVVDSATDKNGQAKATLSTSGDRTNRKITITVKAGGQTATGSVVVSGTSVAIAGPSTVTLGATADYTITVKDSANVAVSGVPVTFSSQKGNAISVKTSGGGSVSAPLTNTNGQVVIQLTASQSASDVLTASAQGAAGTFPITVNSSKLTVSVLDGATAASVATTTTSCLAVKAHYEIAGVPQSGTVNLSPTRGQLYPSSSCTLGTELASSSVALSSGDSTTVYLRSDTAGVSTVTASIVNGPSAQQDVKFIAALTSAATISLLADPAVVGANVGSDLTQRSTLTAVIRDGSKFNNLVEGAVVEFSIVNDKSGGSLTSPSVVSTQSNGTATVVFVAGSADTAKDGVTVQAKLQGTTKTATATLTVAKRSLFISAGTGNKLGTPTSTSYQQDYTVVVTDSAGNLVPNVPITASVYPTRYTKGYYLYDTVNKFWKPQVVATCANEDSDQDGILGPNEDVNLNGTLEPGIPVAVTANATTDATGTATISLVYPRDRANWVEVKLTVRGGVSGTESIYQTPTYFLPVLASDVADQNTAPPGVRAFVPGFTDSLVISPYGYSTCNSKN